MQFIFVLLLAKSGIALFITGNLRSTRFSFKLCDFPSTQRKSLLWRKDALALVEGIARSRKNRKALTKFGQVHNINCTSTRFKYTREPAKVLC